MQHGEIEVTGSHEELVNGDNSYHRMWQSMLKRDTVVMGEAIGATGEDANAI